MATAREYVINALTEIGAYAPGEPSSPELLTLGMTWFQRQMDAWLADELALQVQTRTTFNLTAGTSTFTIGPTGDLVTQRPTWIDTVNYVIPGSNPPVETPMASMDQDNYAALSIKTMSSSLPQQYFYNATTTNGTMFVWPQVTQTVQLALYLPQGTDVPVNLNSVILGPPGYAEAWHYQLAMRLCRPTGTPTPDGLPAMATEAFMRMKRPNATPPVLGVDQALVNQSGGGFNVLTGTWTGASSR